MSIQNTLAQADGFVIFCDSLANSTPKISSRGIGRMGWSAECQFDSVSTIVTAFNPIIAMSLSILIDVASSKKRTTAFLSQSGYTTNNNSTFILKPVDDNYLWIQEKSRQLFSMLRTEDVESGITSSSEVFVRQTLGENRSLALQVVNKVYLDNVGNSHVQIGILHLSSHIEYYIGYPTLQTIAIAALSDPNDDVRDYAVQCYENWNHKDGLRVLKKIHTNTQWLQDYIDSVIVSLSDTFPEVASA